MSLEVPLSESGSVASASRPACASQSRNRPMTTYQLARREEARAAVVHYDLVDLLNTHTSFNQLLNCHLVCCHRRIGLPDVNSTQDGGNLFEVMKERLAEFVFLFWRHYHIESAITSIVVDLDAYKVFK